MVDENSDKQKKSHTAVSRKQKDISTAGRNQYGKYGSWIHNIQSQPFLWLVSTYNIPKFSIFA